MSSTIPLWLQVVMWIVPLVVTLMATGFQTRWDHPVVARRLFVAGGVLFVVALELTLINLAEALSLARSLALVAQLLALSLAVNVWMAFAIGRARRRADHADRGLASLRDEFRAAEASRAAAVAAQKAETQRADEAARLYEEEEKRFWTHKGLEWEVHEIPPKRKGDRYGIQVSVRSDESIVEPIRLRFWFNEEVRNPRVEFIPDPQNARPRPVARVVEPEEAAVHSGGRVDICWGTGFRLFGASMDAMDVLEGSARLRLTVYAETPETPLEIRNVERRYRLS